MAASKTNNIQNTYADDILYSQVPNDRNVESVINSDFAKTYHSFQFIMTTPSYREPICDFLWKKHHPTLFLTPPHPHHFMEVINISKQHNIFK